MSIAQECAQNSIGVVETSAKTAGELLELIPQEVAASPGLIKRQGEVTLVACRDFTDEDAERLGSLTHREYVTLLLAADPRGRREIAADLDIALETVKNHLGSAYEKLGVVGVGRGQATTFIPMDTERLPRVAVEGEASTILDPLETAVFEALADGLTTSQITQKLRFGSDSTTQSIRHDLGKKLGIQGPNGFVLLVRTAGALRNLNRYKDMEPNLGELLASLGGYASRTENESAASTNASDQEDHEELVERLCNARRCLAEANAVRDQALIDIDNAIYSASERGFSRRKVSKLTGISLGKVQLAVDNARRRQLNLA